MVILKNHGYYPKLRSDHIILIHAPQKQLRFMCMSYFECFSVTVSVIYCFNPKFKLCFVQNWALLYINENQNCCAWLIQSSYYRFTFKLFVCRVEFLNKDLSVSAGIESIFHLRTDISNDWTKWISSQVSKWALTIMRSVAKQPSRLKTKERKVF